jgi:hypothetical protein
MMSGWALSGMEIIPSQTKKSGNVHFDSTWVKMRKGQPFTLLVKGVFVDGEEVKIQLLRLEPFTD